MGDSTIQEHDYPLGSSKSVEVSVQVGFAQRGHIVVTLDRKVIAEGAGIDDLKTEAAAGSNMIIVSTVMDVRPETNKTSVIAAVEGGKQPLVIRGSKQVSDNATIVYVYVVRFR